ncbi:MAG: DUF4097 domain-containing protein [Chlorobi bacterium]|nr:DUF4097 domain-containing protein [Chlorobiota bacterium]
MKKRYLITTILTLAVLFTVNHLQAGPKGIEKILFEKSYPVQSMADLLISQETGSITCENWDKNEISVKLSATAETGDREKAEKEFDRVIWNITGNSKEVSVSCKLAPNRDKKSRINVNLKLEIFMPRSVNLELKQKYGNAFIAVVDGLADLTSQYGSINVNALNAPESKLKVDYGKGHVNRFESGDLYINYSVFNLYSTKKADLNSKYSDIKINRAGNLRLELEGGTMNMDSVSRLKGWTKYSTLNIKRLAKSLDIDNGYGTVSVSYIAKGFEEISVENKYGTINLNISEDATYTIEAEMEYCTLNYPESLTRFNYRVKTTGSTEYKGVIGKGDNPVSKVSIQSKFGNVNLKAK